MTDSARSKTGSGDSKTDAGTNDGKPELIGKLADRKPARVDGDTEPGRDSDGAAEVNPSHSHNKGQHDGSPEAGTERGEHDLTGLGTTERGSEHGRHEAAEGDEIPAGEIPGHSPAQRNLEAAATAGHQADHLSADRPDVPEDERREVPHRVEAPKYPGPLPGESQAEFEGRMERSAGDHVPSGSEAFHAALITGEAQAGHAYPHQRP